MGTELPYTMLAIDIACRSQMIAIEFDGPTHFLRSVETGEVMNIENGQTKAKRRFLERLGWKVINIHYHDWIEAIARDEQVLFLRYKLASLGESIATDTAPILVATPEGLWTIKSQYILHRSIDVL